MSQVKRFAMNMVGRDFAVGDIHGHFTRLQAALDAAGFDPAVDRLFSVGDLVDRGPESLDVDEWVLLQILKDVRQWQNPAYHADSAEDCVAYSALKAEALCRASGPKNLRAQ